MFRSLPALALAALASCSTLEVPGEVAAVAGPAEARAVLDRATRQNRDPWGSVREVRVGYDGEWTGVVARLQPVLVDKEHRKTSRERYQPRQRRIEQTHSGPSGVKRVVRDGRSVEVIFEDRADAGGSASEEERAAAALVADAYQIFLFGPSFLLAEGVELERLAAKELGGETCDRIQGRLRPGLGFAAEDRFIAWIGRDSGRMHRIQFTIDGLASTRGADVDVTFSGFERLADGREWPTRFVEYVHRPVFVKAHEWRMTSLEVDGRKLK